MNSEKYNFTTVEKKWQQEWRTRGSHLTGSALPKKYILNMFPYPSGDLHMGHVRAYTIGDILARYYRAQGFSVLHPMGWDALGLPAENAAIKDGIAPQVRTPQNVTQMKAQMERLALSYDWSREIATYQPDYYRWNQWFFIRLYQAGLIYRRESSVNFCPSCQTVLANEQVEEGRCWRCDSLAEQKRIPEWAFRTTQFADSLLAGLETLKEWPERITSAQRHWIGRSEGLSIRFKIAAAPSEHIEIFTTRADTLLGVTFLSIAPEHPLAQSLLTEAQRPQGLAFIQRVQAADKAERTQGGVPKEGIFTGSYALHPLTQAPLPIWLANFVLPDYGSGAVMGVPAHDQRDFEFAKAYDLPMKVVISAPSKASQSQEAKALTCDGLLIDSGEWSGLTSAAARTALADYAVAHGLGAPSVNYHLRDWGFSRQRYWGTPIPIIYCEEHGAVPLDEAALPLLLPDFADVQLKTTGDSPLSRVSHFVNAPCSICQKPSRREVETMDTFVDSAWYFLRFLSPGDATQPFDPKAAAHWLPIDVYIGGPEHAVGHLLYFRFFTQALHHLGMLQIQEPARQLITQGMVLAQSFRCMTHGYLKPSERAQGAAGEKVCGQCGEALQVQMEKMSKSKHNGVNPNELCEHYGADTARMYVLFAAPPEKDLEYNDRAVEGISRFLARLYRLYALNSAQLQAHSAPSFDIVMADLNEPSLHLYRLTHKTIRRVGHDTQRLQFNTAISALMELTNEAYTLGLADATRTQSVSIHVLHLFLRTTALLIAPFAPHAAEEFWQLAGGAGLACEQAWPQFDAAAVVDHHATLAVQVNGKLRGEITLAKEATEEEAIAKARESEKIAAHLADKSVRKIIYIPGRLLNFVVG